MERILIIGCGGAGKSTLARQLGEKTGIPVVHLDKLFWRPNWVHITREEFDWAIREEMKKDRWILDGNYDRTLPERLKQCDTVIYLDFSRVLCLIGVLKRIVTSYGKVRPDMAEGCRERIDWEFLKWVWNFNKNHRESNYRILKEARDKRIVVLKNRRAVKRFLQQL